MTYSFAYVCLGYVYLPIYPHHPTWHMLRALNFGHVMNVARAMWTASAVAGRRSASHLPATFRNTEVRFGRTDWIRLNMFDIVIIVIIWYFFYGTPQLNSLKLSERWKVRSIASHVVCSSSQAKEMMCFLSRELKGFKKHQALDIHCHKLCG